MSDEMVQVGGSGYIQRVQKEHNELQGNITRLEEFMGTEQYQALPDLSRLDLMDQVHYMRSYRTVLKVRLGVLARR